MTAALRCITCSTIFAPFGGGNTNRQVAANFALHPCASTLRNRDDAMRPEVVQVGERRWHPADRGGAA